MLSRLLTESSLRLGARAIALLGAFWAMYGVGCLSWPGAAAGAALLLPAGALVYYAEMRARMPVLGAAHVLGASAPPARGMAGECVIRAMVEVPDLAYGWRTEIREPVVAAAKWPRRGDRLPVEVERYGYPRRVRVLWNSVTAREHVTVTEDPFSGHDSS